MNVKQNILKNYVKILNLNGLIKKKIDTFTYFKIFFLAGRKN